MRSKNKITFATLSSIGILLFCSCSLQEKLEDYSVLDGKWVSEIQIEGKLTSVEINAIASKKLCPTQVYNSQNQESSEGYKISGSISINAQVYKIEGDGSCGIFAPPAVSQGPMFNINITSSDSEIRSITGMSLSKVSYGLFFIFNNKQLKTEPNYPVLNKTN
jgi:hypothetical protein